MKFNQKWLLSQQRSNNGLQPYVRNEKLLLLFKLKCLIYNDTLLLHSFKNQIEFVQKLIIIKLRIR